MSALAAGSRRAGASLRTKQWSVAISGIVGLAGGLGGFVLPIMFGALLDLTGVRSSAFMLMCVVVWVSLIWMYRTEVRTRDVVRGEPLPAAA